MARLRPALEGVQGQRRRAELWTKLATETTWTKVRWDQGSTVYTGPTMAEMATENHPMVGIYGSTALLGRSSYVANDKIGTSFGAVAPR